MQASRRTTQRRATAPGPDAPLVHHLAPRPGERTRERGCPEAGRVHLSLHRRSTSSRTRQGHPSPETTLVQAPAAPQSEMMQWIRSHPGTKAALLAVIATFVGVAVLVLSTVSRSDAAQQSFKDKPPIPSAVNLTLSLDSIDTTAGTMHVRPDATPG